MGLFGKGISDREWVGMVSPLLKILLPQLAKYDQAVHDDSWEDQIAAIESIGGSLVATVMIIKAAPSLSSSKSRQHKKDFEWALKRYMKAMLEGQRLLNTLESGLGARTQWGGMSGGAATRRANLQVSSYKMSVMSARHRLSRASEILEGDSIPAHLRPEKWKND